MIQIGIDDTDSLRGMCTTYLAGEIASRLDRSGFQLAGPPRLVRLNPTIELKTRGNAALALQVGREHRGASWTGRWAGRDLHYHSGSPDARLTADLVEVEAIVAELLKQRSDIANGANPGYVVTPRPPPAELYRRGVQEFVEMDEAIAALPEGARYGGWNGSLGIVGAACAVAWPAERSTWELIAYREPARWGTRRALEAASVVEMEHEHPETFNSYDQENGRVIIAPRSPCPVLFGVRATGPARLREAARRVRTREDWDDCLLFLTNQATGDHVIKEGRAAIEPGITTEVVGTVERSPQALSGGHVVFPIATSSGERIDCTAYEPTKAFRSVVRTLRAGDRIRVRGSVRAQPRTINLESFDMLETSGPERVNPVCVECRRSMESAGRSQGYRCRRCGTAAPGKVASASGRSIRPGRYEVPVSAMRHLHRPLRLDAGH